MPDKPWDELLSKARDTSRRDTPEAQMTYLRDLQLALDAHPPRGGELRIREEMTQAMNGNFSTRLDNYARAWLSETLERFKDIPASTGVLFAKVRLAELLSNTRSTDERERWRPLFTQLLTEVLDTPADKFLTVTPDGQILSREQIKQADMPEKEWAKLVARDPEIVRQKDQLTRLYREDQERNRLGRFQQLHRAAAEVLVRAQTVIGSPDLTRANLLKQQARFKGDEDCQRAITEFVSGLPDFVREPLLAEWQRRLRLAQARLAELRTTLSARDPALLQAQSDVDSLERALSR
jgi:hypothetical protein